MDSPNENRTLEYDPDVALDLPRSREPRVLKLDAELRASDPAAYWTAITLVSGIMIGAAFSMWVLLHYRLPGNWLRGILVIAPPAIATAVLGAIWLTGYWRRWCNIATLRSLMRFRKSMIWLFYFGPTWLILTAVSFAMLVFLNCRLDRSNETIRTVTVTAVYTGKRPLHYATIQPAAEFPYSSIPISKSCYRALKDGRGALRIHIREGFLGYKWISREELI